MWVCEKETEREILKVEGQESHRDAKIGKRIKRYSTDAKDMLLSYSERV